MRVPNYDKTPFVPVPPNHAGDCWRGWKQIGERLRDAIAATGRTNGVVAVECYSGVIDDEIRETLAAQLRPALTLDARRTFKSANEIDELVAPFNGGDDPVFGYVCSTLELQDFLAADALQDLQREVAAAKGLVLIVGPAASIVAPQADVFVFADMPRWEGQLRQRRNEVPNLGADNRTLKASLKYKRAFFIDWRVCDRHKRRTMERWDFVLDTCVRAEPKMISGQAHFAALQAATTRPFRVAPFFDPGPWGGQWMKEVCDLDRSAPNYAWCFDCVPEENSLLLGFGDMRVEIPAMNLVLREPERLLGTAVYGRFGAEFPIRFDFLDTIDGGNLSFQVHPTTQFAREAFGQFYTQDESYYILAAQPGAQVYLGAKRGVNPDDVIASLEAAQRGAAPFDDERYAARFSAKAHDHFLIPAGTLHCSAAGCMVLEISATPYIFTFKLWDWNRLGFDGLPRPVNIERGRHVIDWRRDEDYARKHLINQFTEVARGDGWIEERTGLHEAEFIETRRHWFTGPVLHRRTGGVEVLNLVEGEAAVVESPSGAFAPFEVHYIETFILPAAAGDYVIRPKKPGARCATMKAFVRTKAEL